MIPLTIKLYSNYDSITQYTSTSISLSIRLVSHSELDKHSEDSQSEETSSAEIDEFGVAL